MFRVFRVILKRLGFDSSGPPPKTPLPGLDVVAGLIRDERQMQVQHFESLDAKAGLVLGFAGVLVTIAPGRGQRELTLLGVFLAVLAALFAVSALWLAEYHSQHPVKSRNQWLTADEQTAKLQLLDTENMWWEKNDQLVETKARRLKRALICLVASILLLAGGVGFEPARTMTHDYRDWIADVWRQRQPEPATTTGTGSEA